MSNATIAKWLNEASAARKRYGDRVDDNLKRLETATDKKLRIHLINQVCEANLQLVASTVNKFVAKRPAKTWNEEKTLDLLQEGYFGLRRAAEKFEFSKGCKFSTYAVIWISQAIRRHHLVNYSLIYIPESTLSEVFYQRKHGQGSGSKRRTSNPSTLRAAEAAISFKSLDTPVAGKGDVEGATLGDLITFAKKPPTPLEGEHTWASRMLEDALAEAGIGGAVADLVRAYARKGRLPSAAQAVGLSEHTARPILRAAIKQLEHLA